MVFHSISPTLTLWGILFVLGVRFHNKCAHISGERALRRHLLAVVCRDLGEDVSKWSRADVVVDVAPPNDNPPHFERQLYECDVSADSGSAVDDVITTVKAVDVDAGVSGQVRTSRVVFNQSMNQFSRSIKYRYRQ